MGRAVFYLLLTLAGTLFFQACSINKPLVFSELKSETNGSGYMGKPDPYDFRDPNQLCLEKGANGKPLPNSQIFLFPDGGVQLVREQCADITPKTLTPQDYTIAANGDIIYQNQSFASNLNQSSFDVVAASCPAGKTLLANPVRSSLIEAPLDLQSTEWAHEGLTVSLEGSLASLPVFKIERTDPNLLPGWHRMNQSLELQAAETYVFSFYAKTNPSERVIFASYFANNHDFRLEFDLMTGASVIQSTVGVNLLSTQARMFAGGLYINIYFQVLSDSPTNIGMASQGEFLGSSISATAIQLEKTSNFCAP